MKMNKFLSYMAMAGAMLLLSVSGAMAQRGVTAPDHQLGMGVFAGGGESNADTVATVHISGGATFQYAFSAAVQVGIELSFSGASQTNFSQTFYQSAVYGRFLLEGPLNPFFQAGFRTTGVSTSNTVGTTTISQSATGNQLYAGFGLAYYATPNVGIFTMVELLNLDLSPSQTRYGIRSGRAGAEWWFNR